MPRGGSSQSAFRGTHLTCAILLCDGVFFCEHGSSEGRVVSNEVSCSVNSHHGYEKEGDCMSAQLVTLEYAVVAIIALLLAALVVHAFSKRNWLLLIVGGGVLILVVRFLLQAVN